MSPESGSEPTRFDVQVPTSNPAARHRTEVVLNLCSAGRLCRDGCAAYMQSTTYVSPYHLTGTTEWRAVPFFFRSTLCRRQPPLALDVWRLGEGEAVKPQISKCS